MTESNIKIAENDYITSITTIKYKELTSMYAEILEIIDDLRGERKSPIQSDNPCYRFDGKNRQLWLVVGQPKQDQKFRMVPDLNKSNRFIVVNDIEKVSHQVLDPDGIRQPRATNK